MKNFLIEHSIVPGFFLNKKLDFVEKENAHIWKDEDEFNKLKNSPLGKCRVTIRQELYKFVSID